MRFFVFISQDPIKLMKTTRRTIRLLRTYNCAHPTDISKRIQLHNYGSDPALQDFWLPRFIEAHGLCREKSVGIFSVFGLRSMIRLNRSQIKLFMARENLHRSNWVEYDDLALEEKSIDLCLGFDYDVDDPRYMRFPLWITWLLPPDAGYKEVKEFCDTINRPDNSSFDDRKFCAFISSHDDIGRNQLFDEISQVGAIDSCGRFKHNCEDLQNKYGDDKLEFLRHYRFNLCPENSDYPGYCTEKIFEAITSGCIPLYWGSDNNPEPDILNPSAIQFVNVGRPNNADTLNRIAHLNNDREAYLHMAAQPRLLPQAPDIIMDYLRQLEERIKEISY